MTTTIMCKLMWFKFVSWDFRPAASGAVEMFYGARTNERSPPVKISLLVSHRPLAPTSLEFLGAADGINAFLTLSDALHTSHASLDGQQSCNTLSEEAATSKDRCTAGSGTSCGFGRRGSH